jgi:hypothetical protein
VTKVGVTANKKRRATTPPPPIGAADAFIEGAAAAQGYGGDAKSHTQPKSRRKKSDASSSDEGSAEGSSAGFSAGAVAAAWFCAGCGEVHVEDLGNAVGPFKKKCSWATHGARGKKIKQHAAFVHYDFTKTIETALVLHASPLQLLSRVSHCLILSF